MPKAKPAQKKTAAPRYKTREFTHEVQIIDPAGEELCYFKIETTADLLTKPGIAKRLVQHLNKDARDFANPDGALPPHFSN